MQTILLALAVIIAFLLGRRIEKRKTNTWLRLNEINENIIQAKEESIASLKRQNQDLENELSEVKREMKSMAAGKLMLTPQLNEKIKDYDQETAQAYELYLTHTRNVKYVFKAGNPIEDLRIVNTVKHGIKLYGIDVVKHVYIGAQCKRLLYETDAKEMVPISARQYVLVGGIVLEKFIEQIASKIQYDNN